jgi:phosphate transport system protein
MAPGPSGSDQSESPSHRRQPPTRHAIREQDELWTEFLSLAESVVASLEKSVQALCEGRFDLIDDLEHEEEDTNRREVRVEQECLRVLALYEPVASDLRRMATVLKVNRDWEHIGDLAIRIAKRARKRARKGIIETPETLKQLARDVLEAVRACFDALKTHDSDAARAVIARDQAINRQYRAIRKQCKTNLAEQPEQIDDWLSIMNSARNLERVADHASGIAQTSVFLEEGIIIRHNKPSKP